ncbi:MAG: histidine--tRNA ligase [Sphaerochaetaceae bacterium]|nr:histidine--tRNA ligase [Sphaerochaetaceae bacterium]
MKKSNRSRTKMIQSRVLKGFRDSLPRGEQIRKSLIARLEKTFESYGFVPIDTPALEYTEILLGKGGGETDKQIFQFRDNGGRDVALRYDLTVPFARFFSMHHATLPSPFKRYHIAKVWRGEKPQNGRYREFFQCDFDIVGTDSVFSDAEILMMMISSFRNLGIDGVRIHVAHRGLFNTFLMHAGISEKSEDILRTVDKMRKIGTDATRDQLVDILSSLDGVDAVTSARTVLDFITCREESLSNMERIDLLESLSGGESASSSRLRQLLTILESSGMADAIMIDPSITRGLDYYTGIVYETFFTDLPSIGSVCSGGRYDNLTGLYMKEPVTGVGSSIGLDRLIAALEELTHPLVQESPSAEILIFNDDRTSFQSRVSVAEQLRTEGLRVDLYLDQKKMALQFKYAQQHDIPYGLFVREDDSLLVRDLKTRKDITVQPDMTDTIKRFITQRN